MSICPFAATGMLDYIHVHQEGTSQSRGYALSGLGKHASHKDVRQIQNGRDNTRGYGYNIWSVMGLWIESKRCKPWEN
jgi:hypothetical protein